MRKMMENGGPGPMMKKMMESGCMKKMMEKGCMKKMMENPCPMMKKMMENGGCPLMRKMMEGCRQRQEQAEQQEQLDQEFCADPAQAAAAQEALRIAEEAEREEQARALFEKQRRLEEIEAKKIELAEQKFQLAAMRESMKKSKKELKQMKKGNKMAKKKEKEVQRQTEQVKQLSRATQQKCKEVTHLDLAETAVLPPGGCQLKTWKVKNTGNTMWDDNTFAEFAKGNKSIVAAGSEVAHVGAVEPGHVAYIRVMLDIPEQAGDYSVTYRLSAPVTGRFGKPLRTMFTVQEKEQEFVDSPPVSAQNSVIADREVDDFAEQITEPPVQKTLVMNGGMKTNVTGKEHEMMSSNDFYFKGNAKQKTKVLDGGMKTNVTGKEHEMLSSKDFYFKDNRNQRSQAGRMMENPVSNRMVQRQGMFKQQEERGRKSGMIESPVQNRMVQRSDFQFQEPAFQYAEELKTLMDLGFSEDVCKNTLVATNGNVEEAVNVLLA